MTRNQGVKSDLQPGGINRSPAGSSPGNWAPVPMKQDALQHLLIVEGDFFVWLGQESICGIKHLMKDVLYIYIYYV